MDHLVWQLGPVWLNNKIRSKVHKTFSNNLGNLWSVAKKWRCLRIALNSDKRATKYGPISITEGRVSLDFYCVCIIFTFHGFLLKYFCQNLLKHLFLGILTFKYNQFSVLDLTKRLIVVETFALRQVPPVGLVSLKTNKYANVSLMKLLDDLQLCRNFPRTTKRRFPARPVSGIS